MYTGKPKEGDRCFLCNEPIGFSEFVGGTCKGSSPRFAHKRCWDAEQAALRKKVKR